MARKMKETTLEERTIIIKLHTEGQSYRNMGKIVGRSFVTIQKIVQKFKKTNSLENKSRSGRPSKLSVQNKRYLVREVEKKPDISAPKLVAQLKESLDITVSSETVRRVLRERNLHGRTAILKSFISAVNQKKRLLFAKRHRHHPVDFWKKVIFSDESKINIFSSDGFRKVWRQPGEPLKVNYLRPTVKHGGGSVLVWGCFSASGVGNLVFIDGIMDRFKYIDIIKNNLGASAKKLNMGTDYMFQQDNDPKHTAWDTKMWLLYNTPKMLNTPPQSPDLNPIEHLWAHLKKQIRKHRISSKETLKTALTEEWDKIAPNYCKKLVDSMQRRLEAVIKSRGNPTKY